MNRIVFAICVLLLAGCQQNPVQSLPAAVAAPPASANDLAEQLNDANGKRFDGVEARITLIQEKLIELNQQLQRTTVQSQQQLAMLQWLQQSQQLQTEQQAEQQSGPSTLDQLTELVFRLEQMSAESQQQDADMASSAVVTEPVYQLVSVYGPKGWVVLKYDSLAGTTWKAEAGNWKRIEEVGVLPESSYQVVMEPIEKDVRGHVAARIDRNNGITWWLKDNQWEPF
ncbi:MAG: hypothetical protein V7752_14105 [Halopseudomonas sp.]